MILLQLEGPISPVAAYITAISVLAGVIAVLFALYKDSQKTIRRMAEEHLKQNTVFFQNTISDNKELIKSTASALNEHASAIRENTQVTRESQEISRNMAEQTNKALYDLREFMLKEMKK